MKECAARQNEFPVEVGQMTFADIIRDLARDFIHILYFHPLLFRANLHQIQTGDQLDTYNRRNLLLQMSIDKILQGQLHESLLTERP